MPRYDYECPLCGKVEEHVVTVETIDAQVCECQEGQEVAVGMKRRPHWESASVHIPEGFHD